MVGLLKPTLVTNSAYLNLVCDKNLNFLDFSYQLSSYDDAFFCFPNFSDSRVKYASS